MQPLFFTTLLAGLPLMAAQTTTALPGVPDKPVPGRPFVARIWNDTAHCDPNEGAWKTLFSSLECLNYPSPGTGSVTVKVGVKGRDTLTGWTGPDCTGERIVFDPTHELCQPLGGVAMQSWNHVLLPAPRK
ncbi:hypothetical protein PG987_002936 [Apiospora arundinis]